MLWKDGVGGEKDAEKALKYYGMAASQGHAGAMFQLSMLKKQRETKTNTNKK